MTKAGNQRKSEHLKKIENLKKFENLERTWQDAWSISAHAQCRQLSSPILAKLFSFINLAVLKIVKTE